MGRESEVRITQQNYLGYYHNEIRFTKCSIKFLMHISSYLGSIIGNYGKGRFSI
jgi:hypothetical protein